jgi:signal transduction histidine kinase
MSHVLEAPPENDRRARTDLIASLIVLALASAAFAAFDAVERIASFTARFEHAELDELLLGLVLAVVLAAWFAARRWSESRAGLQALRASERVQQSYVMRLEQLSSELLLAEERERNRVASLVHDELGQPLYACRLRLSLLHKLVPEGAAKAMCGELDALTREALERARDLALNLSPPALTELGLCEALAALSASLERRYGVPIALEPSPAFAAIPTGARAALFHSVKELVLNAVKHAEPQRIAIGAQAVAGAIELHVEDEGCGFEASARAQRAGFGLFSIERRMACLGGVLELQSRLGRGTRAILCVPSALPELHSAPK